MTIFEKVLLEKEKRRKRKHPVFYYFRLRKREKDLVRRYRAARDAERKEKDPKKRAIRRIRVLSYKNRLDRNRIQQRMKTF